MSASLAQLRVAVDHAGALHEILAEQVEATKSTMTDPADTVWSVLHGLRAETETVTSTLRDLVISVAARSCTCEHDEDTRFLDQGCPVHAGAAS